VSEPTPTHSQVPAGRTGGPFSPSIVLKLTLLVTLVVLATAGAGGWAAYELARRIMLDQIEARLMGTAIARGRLLGENLERRQERLALIGSRTRLRELLEARLDGRIENEEFLASTGRILADARASTPHLRELWILDPDGVVCAATAEERLGADFSGEPTFLRGRESFYVLPPEPTAAGGPRMRASGPIHGPNGAFLGVLVAEENAADLFVALLDRDALGETGAARLGVPEPESDQIRLWPGSPAPEPPFSVEADPAMALALRGRRGFLEVDGDGRGRALAAHEPLARTGWGLVVEIDVAEAYAPIYRLRRILIGVYGALALVGWLWAYRLARNFAAPLVALSSSAAVVAGGGLAPPVRLRRNDEIGRLAEAFNRMTHRLAEARRDLETRVEERTRELLSSREELAASRRQLQSILDNTTAVIYVKDREGRYLLINRWYERLFHVTREEIVGKTDLDYFPAAMAEAFRANDRKVLACGAPLEFEEIAPQDDGLHTYISLKFPLENAQGEIYAVCGISTDITERKRAQQALQDVNAELERRVEERTRELSAAYDRLERAHQALRKLDLMKTAFLDVTSHELMTPMTVMSGMLSVLERQAADWPKDQLRRLRTALRSARRLRRMFLRALEVTRRGRYGRRPRLGPVSAADLVRQVREDVDPFVEIRGQRVLTGIEPDLPDLMMDRAQIRDALTNLMMNAIKFTPDGGRIEVAVRRRDAEAIEFRVTDSGIGVSEAEKPHLFEEFFAGLNPEHHSSGEYEFERRGPGLGLAIVRTFVQMHGGSVGMDSPPTGGSNFYFTLPLRPPEDDPPA